MNIVPRILHADKKETAVVFPERIQYALDGFEVWCVQAFLERLGIQSEVVECDAHLSLIKDEGLAEEEYQISVNEQIVVKASSEKGVIWALTTLYKLIVQKELSVCQIADRPKYYHRGLLLDCARHFFSAAEVKRIIEQISLAKMNVLHWHLSDDQGWRIESKKYPKLQQVSGDYFTQEEIRDVVAFAKVRGVEVIPEIDMPGHVTAMVSAYPELCCTGEQIEVATGMGIYSDILCAGKKSTFAFIENLLDEICPLFESKRFHMGGDEAPKTRWKECPHCLEKMKELHLDNFDDLQGYFSVRVADILKKNGKYPITWNDNLRTQNLPEDMEVQYWSLQYNKQTEAYVKNGGKWIYSDMFELYFDYPYSMTPMKKVYETVPHLGVISVSNEENLLGMEAAIWCEHINDREELEKRLFPRIYALAEILWSGSENYDEFCERVKFELHRLDSDGVAYMKKEWWDPRGHARRREALAYMKHMNQSMSKEKKAETVEATKPSPEFGKAFMDKFFKKSDILFLLPIMFKK